MKPTKRKVFAFLLVFIMAFALTACSEINSSDSESDNTNTQPSSTSNEATIKIDKKVKNILRKKYSVGNTVKMGIYDEFADGSGNDKDIEWEVIKIDEENNKVLLRTKMIIDGLPYNKVAEETTWGNCSLRKWLNEDFYMRAFSESERYIIAETLFMYDNFEVTDKVFLPSYEEACDSKTLAANRGSTGPYRTKATSYAFKQGVPLYSKIRWSPPVRTQRNNFYYDSDDKWSARYKNTDSYCSWWLRPMQNNSTSTEIIDGWGSYEIIDVKEFDSVLGVRPAIWLDLSIKPSKYKVR
jgi:hypothetical protein